MKVDMEWRILEKGKLDIGNKVEPEFSFSGKLEAAERLSLIFKKKRKSKRGAGIVQLKSSAGIGSLSRPNVTLS